MDKKQLVKLISAYSMADGGLYRRGQNHNAYFAMNMLTKHDDYIERVKNVFEQVVHVNKAPVKNPCKQPQTNLTSRSNPLFTSIHGRIYRDDGYKGLDEHFIQSIDWEILAIFYMADGSLFVEQPNKKKGLVNPSPNVTLNMKRLSYGDTWFLKKCLKDCLDLEWNISKQFYKGKTYYSLRLRNKDVEKFMKGIAPFVVESFNYKLYNVRTENPA